MATRRSLAGGAVLALLGTGACTAERRGAATFHPDAALIALCTEVGVLRDRFNGESTLDSRECPLWAAYTQAADAITAAKPQTIAGMVAIARAAKLEAACPDGSDNPSGSVAETWAWNLVNDLIQLGGRA